MVSLGCCILAGPVHAQALAPLKGQAAEDLLAQVLPALARQPLVSVPFVERRISALQTMPLESRGTLSYSPGENIEKITTSPIRESVVISADSVSVRSGNAAPNVIRFDASPNLAAYAGALRAVLAGDGRALRRTFEIRMSGTGNRWEMLLVPLDATLKRGVARIVVAGDKGRLRLIETTETSGDVSELTLIAR